MPPLALAALFHRALPWLSPDGRAVIRTLICDNGRVGSAQALCERLGLRSRFQLNRLLHREGLPPYEELAGWVCVFYWLLQADAGGGQRALRSLAGQAHMEAASCYRLVRRVTGRCWKKLRRVGTDEAVRMFLQRTNAPRALTPDVRQSPRKHYAAAVSIQPASESPCDGEGPRRLALSGSPYGVAVRGRDLAYVTRAHAAAIERVDLLRGGLGGSIPLGCTPTCVAFSPSGLHAYVSVQFSDEIAVIDTVRHEPTRVLCVSGQPYPLVVSPSGHTLYVATNEDRLFGICPQNGRLFGSLRLPTSSHHLALHPAGGRLYVATRTGGSVLEVDTRRYEVLRTFSLGGWTQGLVVSADGTTLFAANEQHGLDVVRLATGKCIKRLELESGAVSLARSPDDRLLYAGLVHAGKVAAIDLTSHTLRAVLNTGGRPREIAFGPGHVIVANESGWIDLLPMDRRRIYSFDKPSPPTAPVALSVS